MKNYILKSIIFTLFVSLFTSCSENETQEPFEPVTIDFVGVNVNVDDTSFTADGYTFNSFRAETVDPDPNIGAPIPMRGVALWNGNSNGTSSIELLLNNLERVSTIIITFADYGGQSTAELYSNGNVVDQVNFTFNSAQSETVTFDVTNTPIEKIRFASFEGIALSIRLE